MYNFVNKIQSAASFAVSKRLKKRRNILLRITNYYETKTLHYIKTLNVFSAKVKQEKTLFVMTITVSDASNLFSDF